MQIRTVRVFSFLALMFIFLVASAQMRADTVYSSFGPGQSFPTNQYWDVGNMGAAGVQVVAFPFVPNETVTLTSADLALSQLVSPFTPLNLYIESNSVAGPGTILDTLTQVGIFGAAASVVNFTCSTCTVLDAGTTYWIVGQQSDASAESAWLYSPDATAVWYYNDVNGATGPWLLADSTAISAFDINGTTGTTSVPPVPEPSSLLLLASGMLAVLAVGTHRRVARQA